MSWVVVVPVKGASGKSRLDHSERAQLAEAFALDTVTALVGASVVSRVFVVTADQRIAGRVAALGAEIVAEAPSEPDADPLNAAISRGVAVARARFPDADVAVFTGDLPAVASADIEAALSAAVGHERSMIADEEGTGTTAILALAGVQFTPRFGVGSRAAHEAAGHVPLSIPPTAPIRRDVDTARNLAEAVALGVGPHTRRLLAATHPAAAEL